MFKKFLAIIMSLTLILLLAACGRQTASSVTSGNGGKSINSQSKLKGDFVFYMKDDNYTYFTNCENIGETLLYKGKVNKIWIDSKRNKIIFVADKLYYMSIDDKNHQLVSIDDARDIQIVDNKYIVYVCNSNLFVYDLDTKKKEKISERNDNYGHITYKIFDNSKISWLTGEYGESERYWHHYYAKLDFFGTFDLNKKTKKVVDLNDEERYMKFTIYDEYKSYDAEIWSKDCFFNGDALYYVDYIVDNPDDPNLVNSILYEVKADGNKKVIDELQGSVMKNFETKFNGRSAHRNLPLKISIISAGQNGVYYEKDVDWTGEYNEDGYPLNSRKYFYYGYGSLKEIDKSLSHDIFNVSGSSIKDLRYDGDPNTWQYVYNMNFIEPVAYTYHSSIESFFVGDKEFNKDVIKIIPSSDSTKFVCRVNDEDYCLIDSIDGSNEKLCPRDRNVVIYSFDNDNILYAVNNDLLLNQKTIFYNVYISDYNSSDYIEFNNDLSCITLRDNISWGKGNTHLYKNGEVYDVASNVSYSHLTNNGNVYYVVDGNLYLFKDGEATLILSDVATSENSSDEVPGYVVI